MIKYYKYKLQYMPTHVCMKFIYAHFDVNWDKSISPEKVIYIPTQTEAKVLVVREGMTGVMEQFVFAVKSDHEVWVSLNENLIFIPSAPHLRQDGGDVPIIGP